jgi:hypothetical protein
MRRRTTSALAATALFVAALAACGSSSHASSSPITVFNVAADPSRNLPVTDPKHHVALTTATLRLTVDALLSRHVVLVAALVHRVVADDAGAEGPVAALTANTAALTAAIEQVYGADAARAFEQLWTQHTQFFLDYAQAAHDHDGAAKEKAESELVDYQNDFANFVSTATAGGASLAAVTALLHGHVHDVTSYIDADAAGHEIQARQILALGVGHMHVIAQAVSRAIEAQHLKTVKP